MMVMLLLLLDIPFNIMILFLKKIQRSDYANRSDFLMKLRNTKERIVYFLQKEMFSEMLSCFNGETFM